MTEEPYVLRHDDGGVAHVTLNRPNQFNALSLNMITALKDEFGRIALDDKVRVVVLSGAGKAFCAGHDLKEMRANYTLAFQKHLFSLCAELMMKVISIPQPVIARVHGVATAAGCQLVGMCDLAVASETARFAVSGINAGLFCSAPAVALSRNIGRKAAFEMLLTGEFIDASYARQLGLINHVVPENDLDTEIARLTGAICRKPAISIAMGKQMYYRQLEMGLHGAYQLAAETMACNMMTEDAAEGVDAFIEKRKPAWQKQ